MTMTTIQINKETREMMKKYGNKDETYDLIIKRLVRIADKQIFFDRQKQILKEERFVPLEDI